MAQQMKLLQQIIENDQLADQRLDEHDILLRNQQDGFLDLQRTIGELARRFDDRPSGTFKEDMETNPRGHVMAITTCDRGGEEVEVPPLIVEVEDEPMDEELEFEIPTVVHHGESRGDYTYDLEGNYLGYLTAFGDLIVTIPEPGTIMDVSVPPPVHQSQVPEFLGLAPFPSDDDFFSDEEEEDEDSGFKGEDEMVEKPSWEEEFGDELVGLLIPEDDGEFDPVGDLEALESLLAGRPMEVFQSPRKEEEGVEAENHSRPEVEVDEMKPPKSTKPREKARKRKPKDANRLRTRGWCTKKRKTKELKSVLNHSPHYMSRVRFGPGNFKWWWTDLFVIGAVELGLGNYKWKDDGHRLMPYIGGPFPQDEEVILLASRAS